MERCLGGIVISSDQIGIAAFAYANRRRVSRRGQFLETIDATIPLSRWIGPIEPFYYPGHRSECAPT